MKAVDGVWLPDGEQHLVAGMVADYQGDKRAQAMDWVKERRHAIDVGAHCGLWSRHLVKDFLLVYAFEPAAENQLCFYVNVPRGALLYETALGASSCNVRMEIDPRSSAASRVAGAGDIEMSRLDEYEFENVDFIKVDCCGYELPVLHGAIKTLKRWRPCISVEQKPQHAKRFGFPALGAVKFLERLGAKQRAEKSGVYVLSWD